jgi:hypothetical protein
MMERLQQSSSPAPSHDREQGELVVRPDGSQAIRVRRRKRRSNQPKKEREARHKKIRFARIIALIVVLLIAGGVLAGGVIYSNSRPFRDALVAKIAATTGAEAAITQFRMNPASAKAAQLSLNWPAGSPVESLVVNQLDADTSVTSFVGGAFQGPELVAREGTLTLRAADFSQPALGAAHRAGTVGFQSINIAKFHIVPGDSLPGMFQLRDAEASFYPFGGMAGAAQMRVNGGTLRVPYLPELRLDRALLEFEDNRVDLTIARMFNGGDEIGDFILNGSFSPTGGGADAILMAEVNSFKINGLIGERMGRLIAGRIDSKPDHPANTLRFPVQNPTYGVLNLEFESSVAGPVIIQGFNFLNDLAILLEDPWFGQPYFDGNVTGTIRRSNGVVEILNLNAEYRNRMAIRGNLRIDREESLTGKLEVGLSTVVLNASPTRRIDPALSEPSGGYRWITLDIGGTAAATTDNFMSQVDQPPARPTPAPGGDTDGTAPTQPGGNSFEDLTRPR